jgi:hypothetical protein
VLKRSVSKSATEDDNVDGGASQKKKNVAEWFTYFSTLTQQAQKLPLRD